MASTCVEKHDSLVAQEGLHLSKPDAAQRPPHLLDQFLPAAHESSSDSSVSSSLGVGVATPSSIARRSSPSIFVVQRQRGQRLDMGYLNGKKLDAVKGAARPAESIRTASRHSTIAPSTDWSLGLMSIVVANWSPCWPSNRGMVASP